MDIETHPFFIEDNGDRQGTAILLVGTADEFGVDQRSIRAVRGGFRITQELADILASEADEDEDEKSEEPEGSQETTPAKKNKKTSGDRAAKNDK